ncbi:mitochondrial import receptor subunit TOM20 homolog B-like isoform X1 [Bolinopsis microptera]|uniref:mitochondrial import receptor subunit TOM20 homolog B-like isoform X1 n=1 Tax=Bolinopsis microptera TaxID=2820187 RepID=UPI003079EFED
MSKTLIAGGLAATTFVAYCVYFDYKRRSDPMYKTKLRERRRAERNKSKEDELDIPMPKSMDPPSIQKFFMEQVQVGEEKLGMGDFKGAVKHFASAVLHCGQGYQLLQILQSTMPPEAYKMFMEFLPKAQAKYSRQKMSSKAPPNSKEAPPAQAKAATERVIAEEAVD